jgi:uncharacterized membrane protein YedE/YeeE
MKYIKFILVGVMFGIAASKAEFVSWFRIYEMFHFASFHMYGVIGSALVFGVLIIQIIKRYKLSDMYGNPVRIAPKNKSIPRYLFGGIIFGMGWALTGACPGPMFVLVGQGMLIFLVVIVSALAGTFFYGLIKDKLPH